MDILKMSKNEKSKKVLKKNFTKMVCDDNGNKNNFHWKKMLP
jgi:hypothetical protein